MTATYVTGDVFDCLAATPSGSVDLIITSPPFLALRSYLPADHPDKAREIGQESNPAAFVDTLLRLTAEWRRVLAPHGSIAVELGDTYSGAGGYGSAEAPNPAYGDERHVERYETRPNRRFKKKDDGWPEAKSACLVPELYRVALAYGMNPLTGEPSPAGRWRIRNTVRWCRPNPPVGALGDKFRPATSDMVIACLDTPQGQRRYFDLDAVREPADPANKRPSALKREGIDGRTDQVCNPLGPDGQRIISNPAGAPPLDWWEVSTEPYAGSHYATWPRKLLERPIKAMVPQKVCVVCGEPSRRIVDARRYDSDGNTVTGDFNAGNYEPGKGYVGNQGALGSSSGTAVGTARTTLGWTDCGHDAWRQGVVLDPFGGSGTTLAVATGHGHDAIGFDLDERNVDLARDRVGPMFFTHLTLDEYRKANAA